MFCDADDAEDVRRKEEEDGGEGKRLRDREGEEETRRRRSIVVAVWLCGCVNMELGIDKRRHHEASE